MDREIDQVQLREGALTLGDSANNLERYLPEIEDQFVSEEAAMEFLRVLYSIMIAFVDLGWGVDSIHFAIPELTQPLDPGRLIGDSVRLSFWLGVGGQGPLSGALA